MHAVLITVIKFIIKIIAAVIFHQLSNWQSNKKQAPQINSHATDQIGF